MTEPLTVFSRMAATLFLACALACSEAGGVTDATEEPGDAIDGLGLSAAVVLVQGGGGQSIMLVSLQVNVSNTTDEAITRHYPTGCPVRLRLYETGTNGRLAYDETTKPCNSSAQTPLSLQPGQTRVLTSTAQFPWEVAGDSLSPGPYHAKAILRIAGENPVELNAGNYTVPRCVVVEPPGGLPYTQCT
jgi:hypothetical protein